MAVWAAMFDNPRLCTAIAKSLFFKKSPLYNARSVLEKYSIMTNLTNFKLLIKISPTPLGQFALAQQAKQISNYFRDTQYINSKLPGFDEFFSYATLHLF